MSGWLAYFARVAAAGVVMGGVLWWGAGDLDSWIQSGLIERVLRLAGWVAAGALVYFSVIFTLGIRPRQLILSRTGIE